MDLDLKNLITKRQVVWGIVGVSAALFLSAVAIAIFVAAVGSTQGAETTKAIRDTQLVNTKLNQSTNKSLENTQKTLDLFIDCTTPEGECFKKTQRTTSNVVQDITKYAVYAAVCTDQQGQQSIDQTTDCILTLIAAEKPERKKG